MYGPPNSSIKTQANWSLLAEEYPACKQIITYGIGIDTYELLPTDLSNFALVICCERTTVSISKNLQ